jgi:hypothetical protein
MDFKRAKELIREAAAGVFQPRKLEVFVGEGRDVARGMDTVYVELSDWPTARHVARDWPVAEFGELTDDQFRVASRRLVDLLVGVVAND